MIQKNENILFSCSYQEKYETEQIIKLNCLVYIISGSLELTLDNLQVTLKKGDIALLKKNQLVKAIKNPDTNKSHFKSISIFFSQNILRSYCLQNNIPSYNQYKGKPLLYLKENNFLKAYFLSLFPYFDTPQELTSNLAKLKTKEAIELLLSLKCDPLLFDFNEPHKIDIEPFILENFRFNVPLQDFARLTGRSLSTFKRDFKKIFDVTPQRWITAKRLTEAHYLINKQNKRPSDIYYELGFENFSHFSKVYNEKYKK